MSLPATYPPANTTAQPRPAGGGVFDHVEKLVLHTTETAGWPGYPSFAPHLTYDPWNHRWHQHMPLTRSASTLADSSSTKVRENRDFAIQVEIIAYCDTRYNKPGKGIDYLDDQAVHDLADLAAWLHEKGGLELTLAPGWLPYPQSYGNTRNRMSGAEYDAFHGVLGHEHVSSNDHGDPGDPPWLATFLTYAQQAAGQPSTPDTPTTGKALDMAAAENVWINFAGKQPLKPGDNEVWISTETDGTHNKTLVTAPNKGVDLLATIDVTVEGKRAPGVEAFFRVVSYKDKTPTTTISSRRPTTSDQVSFKGSLTADKDKNRSARLRLVVNVPAGVTGAVLDSVQISGWKL